MEVPTIVRSSKPARHHVLHKYNNTTDAYCGYIEVDSNYKIVDHDCFEEEAMTIILEIVRQREIKL